MHTKKKNQEKYTENNCSGIDYFSLKLSRIIITWKCKHANSKLVDSKLPYKVKGENFRWSMPQLWYTNLSASTINWTTKKHLRRLVITASVRQQ